MKPQVGKLFDNLRREGFRVDFRSRSGGCRVVQYSKAVSTRRRVIVQIWEDGNHRASSEFNGCCDTAPTEFTGLDDMLAAIQHETKRMDSRYAHHGSTMIDAGPSLQNIPPRLSPEAVKVILEKWAAAGPSVSDWQFIRRIMQRYGDIDYQQVRLSLFEICHGESLRILQQREWEDNGNG